MRILITGGAGFIGSHVADRMLALGCRVSVVDNLSHGRRENVDRRARLHRANVCDARVINRIFRRERPEIVMHLAAQMNVRVSMDDPQRDAKENILGGLTVLGACAAHRVRRIVIASSGGAIYGEQPSYPCTEAMVPAPMSPYGVAKLALEHYARFHSLARGLDVVNLRLANVYGPRQDPRGEAGVIAIFIGRMFRGEPPMINGDGRQTRDYVYVGDVVSAFERGITGLPGTYNIGTGIETDVDTLARVLGAITGYRGRLKHGPAVKGEVCRSVLDCRLAHRVLKWRPLVPLVEGLRRTAE